MMRQVVMLLLGVGVILGVTVWMLGGNPELWSSQVGYWSSALIVVASFGSYRRMVEKRLEQGMVATEDRDALEKIEDPYELYDEEEPQSSATDLRETIREEKRRLKNNRRSPLQTARDSAPAFSFWRLGAYGVLVAGFFALQGNGMLSIPAYLLSLALPIVLTVGYLVQTGVRNAG